MLATLAKIVSPVLVPTTAVVMATALRQVSALVSKVGRAMTALRPTVLLTALGMARVPEVSAFAMTAILVPTAQRRDVWPTAPIMASALRANAPALLSLLEQHVPKRSVSMTAVVRGNASAGCASATLVLQARTAPPSHAPTTAPTGRAHAIMVCVHALPNTRAKTAPRCAAQITVVMLTASVSVMPVSAALTVRKLHVSRTAADEVTAFMVYASVCLASLARDVNSSLAVPMARMLTANASVSQNGQVWTVRPSTATTMDLSIPNRSFVSVRRHTPAPTARSAGAQ